MDQSTTAAPSGLTFTLIENGDKETVIAGEFEIIVSNDAEFVTGRTLRLKVNHEGVILEVADEVTNEFKDSSYRFYNDFPSLFDEDAA